MRVLHTTNTPSTSIYAGFTGLRGHPYTEEAIDEDSEEDIIEDVYDVATREDTQL